MCPLTVHPFDPFNSYLVGVEGGAEGGGGDITRYTTEVGSAFVLGSAPVASSDIWTTVMSTYTVTVSITLLFCMDPYE